jgi:lysophospholipase L1-like esterase
VQLGDSIASGEGTLYGYTYDQESAEWTGGDINHKWPLPYPLCHVSPDAYGNKVASSFGATFNQFACTGATFEQGISGAPVDSDGATQRPPEFGNWATKTELNGEYDSAKPDLVLVTLGADDVAFSDIVEACVKNGYEYYVDYADEECIADNPGSTVQQDFFDRLPTVKKSYATLVSWIEARAKANDVPVPNIVFTNYANPLPDQGVKCNDTYYLYPEQVQYLEGLLQQMNAMIEKTIEGLGKKNVAVADISKAYQPQGVDHRWCSDDPWAYGLSIFDVWHPSSFDSKAPFHPTPAGQAAIAELVIPTVARLFNSALPYDTTTTSAAPASTTTSTAPPPDTTTSTSDPPPPSTKPDD